MMDATKDLLEKAKSVAGSWGSYAAFGSFLLYLTGYLTLRFHLMAFGIFTDLAILDERYVFAGARFLVYFLGSFSILVMICLPFVPLVGWLRRREKLRSFRERLWAWWSLPNRLAFAGVVLSVVLIQGVMRQCLFFTNLLLREKLPEPEWLHPVLLDPTGGCQSLYFAGLVAGTGLVAAIWFVVRQHTASSRAWTLLLGLLIALQFLWLPINFGVLITDKELPRVSATTEQRWLVWEGKERVTFLVQRQGRAGTKRALVTELKSDVKKLEVAGYDPILRILFRGHP